MCQLVAGFAHLHMSSLTWQGCSIAKAFRQEMPGCHNTFRKDSSVLETTTAQHTPGHIKLIQGIALIPCLFIFLQLSFFLSRHLLSLSILQSFPWLLRHGTHVFVPSLFLVLSSSSTTDCLILSSLFSFLLGYLNNLPLSQPGLQTMLFHYKLRLFCRSKILRISRCTSSCSPVISGVAE